MKYLHNQQIIEYSIRDACRRLVLRLIVMMVIITMYEVLIHSGAFNSLVVHTSNLVVGGMPTK